MSSVNLQPFLRPDLDILFVALNPPTQSNENGHWFSGKQSRFFDLLYKSELISEKMDKRVADNIVFGGTSVNYLHANYGVVDLVEDMIETNSKNIKSRRKDAEKLVARIHEYRPRIVCVIHS